MRRTRVLRRTHHATCAVEQHISGCRHGDCEGSDQNQAQVKNTRPDEEGLLDVPERAVDPFLELGDRGQHDLVVIASALRCVEPLTRRLPAGREALAVPAARAPAELARPRLGPRPGLVVVRGPEPRESSPSQET